jgi:hypothetical protein
VKPPDIRIPTIATLRKYGLSARRWLRILKRQGWVCAICERVPKSGRWVTDHQHVPRFKKMKPEQRRKFVRGVICAFCNSHCVGRFMTLLKARNVVKYLERYEQKRDRIHRTPTIPQS